MGEEMDNRIVTEVAVQAEIHAMGEPESEDNVRTFEFDTWASDLNLKRKTTSLLTKEDLNTEAALALVTTSELRSIGVSLGQAKLIVDSQVKTKAPSAVMPTELTTESQTDTAGIQDPSVVSLRLQITLKESQLQKSGIKRTASRKQVKHLTP